MQLGKREVENMRNVMRQNQDRTFITRLEDNEIFFRKDQRHDFLHTESIA